MHAGIGHHPVVEGLALAHEARVAVMGGGAGAHAVVAADAFVEVDQHRLGGVHETLFQGPLGQGVVFQGARFQQRQACRRRVDIGKHVPLQHRRWNAQDVDIAQRGQHCAEHAVLLAFPTGVKRFDAEIVAGAEIGDRTMAFSDLRRYPGETGANHQQAIGIIADMGDHRLVLGADRAALAQLLIGHVPVELAIGLEQGGVDHLLQRIGVEPGEQRTFRQVHRQGVAPVVLVDAPSPALVVAAELAQSLPADFQQPALGLGEHGGGAGHAAQRRQLAEQGAFVQLGGLILVKHRRHVLEEHPRVGGIGGIAAARRRRGAAVARRARLGHAVVAPKL